MATVCIVRRKIQRRAMTVACPDNLLLSLGTAKRIAANTVTLKNPVIMLNPAKFREGSCGKNLPHRDPNPKIAPAKTRRRRPGLTWAVKKDGFDIIIIDLVWQLLPTMPNIQAQRRR